METCFRCERSEKEVRLLDAIYENDVVKICERCAVVEDILILRRPSTSQLKESEKSYSVYQRLKKLSGGVEKKEKHESILDKIRKLDENPELEQPEEKKPFNLVDNFNWHVTRARRNRGLSQKQLGWALGESEAAVKMIEKGELPEESEKLIKKLEQFLQIKIRERTEDEIEEERRKEREKEKFKIKLLEEEPEFEVPIKPIIEEEDIDELDVVTNRGEPEGAESVDEFEEIEQEKNPVKVLSFKPEVMRGITISDLKRLKEEKEKEERLLATEEERKRALQAESFIRDLEKEEKRKRELRERIASEMKDIALGKETVEEKRKMLNKAMEKVSKVEGKKKEEKAEKKEYIPSIFELMEKKKERDKEKLVGDEIELEE